MKKINVLILLLLFLTVNGAESGKTVEKNVILEIQKISSTEKQITIKYIFKNLSDKDIWVCMSNDTDNKINEKLDTGIVKIVKEKEKSLILEVESIPFDIWTSPLGAFYKLVRKDKSEEFIFTIKSPVVDNSDLSYGLADEKNHKDLKTLDLNDVKDLIIRVGYYTKDLNSTKGCCVNPAKKYPPDIKKVYYDWAKENKEEVVEATISLKNADSASGVKP